MNSMVKEEAVESRHSVFEINSYSIFRQEKFKPLKFCICKVESRFFFPFNLMGYHFFRGS